MALVHVLTHMTIDEAEQSAQRHLSELKTDVQAIKAAEQRAMKAIKHPELLEEPKEKEQPKATKPPAPDMPSADSPWYSVAKAGKKAEQGILDFFDGDFQALDNGVPIGGTEDTTPHLTRRLAKRMANCRKTDDTKTEDCVLRVAFIGSAQTVGRDMFHNESFPFVAEERLRLVAKAAGLELQVMNNAQDSDRSKEGPQSMHLCVGNFVGDSVDVIAWDLDNSMQGAPPAQFEAFVRWAFASEPAMIMINRGGPHARSRRGKRRTLFNFAQGHDASVYEDDPDDIPEPREEPYVGSKEFKARWEEGRNEFWFDLVDQYSDFMDFAAVDPSGSIWTLDHLQAFSNGAFETGKALPLVDCGNDHPAPCDQVPPFIENKLKSKKVSLDDFTKDQIGGGELCAALFGCRNILYGGLRSHELRGELNALPIVRSFRFAAAMLAAPNGGDDNVVQLGDEGAVAAVATSRSRALAIKLLPPPKHCNEAFCTKVPTCMTSYLPNLGPSLSSAIVLNKGSDEDLAQDLAEDLTQDLVVEDLAIPTNDTNVTIDTVFLGNDTAIAANDTVPPAADTVPPAVIPRMGAAHFADNPEFAVANLEKRFAPLGYVDRKYGYRLTEDKPTPIVIDGNATGEFEPTDSPTAEIAFVMEGEGPVVLCEPPCFMDRCSQMRRMPLIPHITMQLDGEPLEVSPELPHATEANGPFCKTVADNVQPGKHTLKLTAITKAPHYTMFSHVITFS